VAFPKNPFQILAPHIRWAPFQEDLQEKAYEHTKYIICEAGVMGEA